MTNNTLKIECLNLDTRKNETINIKASNYYILACKYQKLNLRSLHINAYRIENSKITAGNKGRNAGAYLHEILEELTGQILI